MDEIQIQFQKLHTETIPQPNKVTEMRYATNGIEENMFTLVIDALRQHMTGEKLSYEDLWGEPVFRINLNEIDENNKPNKTFARLRGMQKREFGYEYTSPQDGKNVEVFGSIFTTILKKDSDIEIHINKFAIPWLTYIDKGITYFNKKSALSLKGGHTKRLYKFLASWKSKGGVNKSIIELKEMLDVLDRYPKTIELKRRILDPAKDEMYNNQKSDIWFEYSTYSSGDNGRKHDYIKFKIHSRYKSNNERLEQLRKGVAFELFNEILKFLQYCLGATSEKAIEITGACTNEGDRFCNQRYKDIKGLREKSKTTPQAFNFFMSASQKHSDNKLFELRFKECKSRSKI
ncbi:replication initiation protein [Saccharicrinis aurantiacus]|uniref:replication initiation protein n=1 Tax=Saccharicrinis aurantiacus TaxID=1849719 RepID=UPI00083838E4|nr:replication initiation protein [Saccharicrinis aurantiacus]